MRPNARHHPPRIQLRYGQVLRMRVALFAVGCMPLLGCSWPELLNCQFRHMLIFILLDQDAHYFHQRSERVRLIFPDLIN